ncbi:EpsG family protein [Shimia aestuarii]|uniref:EpsG family protein n=1 Tax=Shimia aestuarii TaxID=254406 RepID=UPI001FB1C9C8|nr:EpsG family protein [Shimia aestuarii]
MIYTFSYMVLGLSALVSVSRQWRLAKALAFIVLALCTILAFARGDVGTDTLAYESLVTVFVQSTGWIGIEPGFIAYVRLAENISDNTVLITRGISLIFGGLTLIFCIRASRDELFVMLAYFAPNYFFQMSMNGLRIGIATVAFLCAVQLIRRGRKMHAMVYLGVAVAFHVSIVFAIVLMSFTLIKVSRARSLMMPVMALVLTLGLVAVAQEYIGDKVGAYTEIVSPGLFSGLSPIARIFVIVMAALSLPLAAAEKKWAFATILLATLLSYAMSTQSYAGLRFLEIIASVVPFLFLMKLDQSTPLNRRFCLGLTIAGILGGLNTLRGFYASQGLGGAPFIPYHFFNETIINRG